ncbi:aminotransferase class I/II-fold pyridoxal phosphate-dependent enzyme [Kitasatospora sp. NPDC096128]|uniref:aminotransferase class I/II-fold pyridoxal phosphate-dependent enzyme n=1 Tax=Kitasatospora sp. NPDC096128 TaxID=3155547 RepID=UPI0033216FD5
MTTLSPTSAAGIGAGVAVLSTGDVRVPVYPAAAALPALDDQPYPPPAGQDGLRAAIAAYATASGTATIRPEQVLVAPGARAAILSVLAGALGDRREVLVPGPYWASYPTLIKAAGGTAVLVPGQVGVGAPSIGALEAALTGRTGALVLNSPRNPDGSVIPAERLRELSDWAEARGLLLLFDQVYRGVPIGDGPAPSVLGLGPELPAHCVVVDGLTKSHALAGLRIGWAIAAGPVLDAATAHASHVIGGTGSTAQRIALAVLGGEPGSDTGGGPGGEPGTQPDRDDRRARLGSALEGNLKAVLERLSGIPGVSCPRPEGGIFAFPDLRGWLAEHAPPGARADLTGWLRDEHRVAVVDGKAFGAPGHVRLSFALPEEDLLTGVDRLRTALTG